MKLHQFKAGDKVLVIGKDLKDTYLGTLMYERKYTPFTYSVWLFNGVYLRGSAGLGDGAADYAGTPRDTMILLKDLSELEMLVYNIDKVKVQKWLTT